ncbi:hypothetical protein TWF718_003592 [Orbilia javanica]|uniref:Uncharacterized protein n=1 Tax=Orbilia javanica TaxID=47235 RepID=A0AAN8NA18_9PEZI
MIGTLIWYYYCFYEMVFFIFITLPLTLTIITIFYLVQECGTKIMFCIGIVVLAVILVLPDRNEMWLIRGERYNPVCLPEVWY